MLKWIQRLYYTTALFTFANHLFLLWNIGKTSGWGGWAAAMAIRFSYMLSLTVGLSGLILAIYGRYRHERVAGVLVAALIAAYGFIDLTIRRLLM